MPPSEVRRLALASLTAMGIAMGCTAYDYQQYAAKEPDKYFGTQPGYHLLSDHFATDVSHGLTRFYYIDKNTQRKEQIGAVMTFCFDRLNSGPREIAYAVSADGRRLLFFDEPGVTDGKPVGSKHGTVAANLYLIDASDARRQLVDSDVHRRGTSCVELPRNYVRFGKIRSIGDIESTAYSTEGREVSLEARRKTLSAQGAKDKICGPL